MTVGPDISLGQWVSKLAAAAAEAGLDWGGGDPPSPDGRRTTGIAANIPPTNESPGQ